IIIDFLSASNRNTHRDTDSDLDSLDFFDTLETLDTLDTLSFTNMSTATPASIYHRPPPYTGQGNIKKWLWQMRTYVKAVSAFATEGDIVNAILTNLDGDASNWAFSMVDDNGKLTVTDEQFIKDIGEQFTKFDDARRAESELQQLKQTGSVDAYISAFQSISLRITGMTDDEKRRWFVAGLKKD
ncbi:hypothetical protein GGI12_006305, partial [Dipsacomyces acuminosporus]